jgi:hypothetical protein
MFGPGLALALALSASVTPAVTPTPPAVAPAKPAKPPKPPKHKLICVEAAPTGSLFPQTTCATAEQWEARRLRDEDQMQRSRDVPN